MGPGGVLLLFFVLLMIMFSLDDIADEMRKKK